jgi:hypothetical protein
MELQSCNILLGKATLEDVAAKTTAAELEAGVAEAAMDSAPAPDDDEF